MGLSVLRSGTGTSHFAGSCVSTDKRNCYDIQARVAFPSARSIAVLTEVAFRDAHRWDKHRCTDPRPV